MAGDDAGDKTLTIRCTQEWRRLIKAGSGVHDLDASEYIRRFMRRQAEDDLGEETIEEIERRASEDDPELRAAES